MTQSASKRYGYMDLLRIVSAFFVIVNHTNSDVFQGSNPSEGIWFASLIWYYLSKMAVPLFVMVSGACLLPKQDTYRKVMGRIVRMVMVTVLFSYGYFLVDAWVYYGLWPRMIQWDAFLSLIWPLPIVDSFWYLYFYVGLLLILPLLQRFAKNATKQDLLYVLLITFGLQAVLPLIGYYLPEAMPSDYLMTTIPSAYIGLFFAGHFLHQYGQKRKQSLWVLLLVACVTISVMLTALEYQINPTKYWFMDDRLMPSILTIGLAVSVFMLCKHAKKQPTWISTLGGLSFGVYLLQQLLIAQSEHRIYEPMLAVLPTGVAMILWEVMVFVFALAITYVLKRIPLIKKLL